MASITSIIRTYISLLCIFIYLFIFTSVTGYSQTNEISFDINDYLGKKVSFNPQVPPPESVLGVPIGTWHLRHEQVVSYMYSLAKNSKRVAIYEYARTHENRPLLLLTITSEKNHANLSAIIQRHQQISNPEESQSITLADEPIVVYMGYSIHGNEPSGTHSAMIMGYYLAASQEPELKNQLENMVILLDPSLNPDGFGRFSYWVNMYKSTKSEVNDPQSKEFNEIWPLGPYQPLLV